MAIFGRTDLASEAHSRLLREGAAEELPGLRSRQRQLEGILVTEVDILDGRGVRALGKAEGRYRTLFLPSRAERGSESFPRAVKALGALLGELLPPGQEGTVLIAALGNPDITPDAVGSLTASSTLVTRHLKESCPGEFRGFRPTALCRTGVLGTTGVESAAQIRALCDLLRPACVLAVDALAGSELEGLCRSVQLCDTGIAPGSGVGNNREALNQQALGVPVIAIGVPTVVDAAALSHEAGTETLFVTPRDIDSAVRAVSRIIGYGINLALHPGLTVEDIDLLLG